MNRPQALLAGTADAPEAALTLADVADRRHRLHGTTVLAVIADQPAGRATLHLTLRGATLILDIRLPDHQRELFVDQLHRVVDLHPVPTPVRFTDEQRALLHELRCGASLDAAARAVGLSRRTAARRLAELRTQADARSTAALLGIDDDP
ncbi:MAG: hypothetical protein OEW42_12855 [Acidimicrobiia bacterium]|nr:hypothetical protein [Acidimicrobiia bacterium]MDH5237260.1 hypothetical protein [Acidimicrobiia bacterium]